MATSRSPSFPQPLTTASTAVPVPSAAGSYFTVGAAQGSGRPPQIPSPTASTSYPPHESLTPQHPFAYPPASQHTPVSVSPHLAFPEPQGRVSHAQTTQFQRSVTMPIPGLPHLAQVAHGPSQSYALQAPNMSHSRSDSGIWGATHIPNDHRGYQDDYYEEDEDDSEMLGDGALAKGPPDKDRPLAGIQKTPKLGNRRKQPPNRAHTLATPGLPGAGINDPPNGPPKGLRAWVRNLVNHGSQHPNQPTTPVRLPQQATFNCRLPECQVPITADIAARLSGFCGNSHMWTAIERPIATLCPGCNRRACLEGMEFCSAECANTPRH